MTDLPDPEVIEQPAPDTSLRDTIKAELAKTQEPAAVEKKADTAPAETAAQAEARTRDETGKFIKGEEGKKRETLTLPKKEEAAPAPPTQASSPIRAPEGWSAPAKAKFALLDPEVQAEVVRRETEMHRKFTSQDEDRTFGKRIKEIAAPYQATMNAEGATHEAAFQAYLNTAYILRTASPEQKQQALLAIARQFNVPLGTPLQQGAAPPAPASMTPAEVRQLTQAEIQQHQDREQQRRNVAEIEAFKSKPGHEHFEDLKGVVKGLLESGRFDRSADPLQDAYDAALRADPELGSGYIAQKLREADEHRAAEAKAKTDAAKRAAGSVTGAPGGVKPNGATAGTGSLRDEIRANLAAAQGRI